MGIGIFLSGLASAVADIGGVGIISMVEIGLSPLIEEGIDILFSRAVLHYDLSKYRIRNKNKF